MKKTLYSISISILIVAAIIFSLPHKSQASDISKINPESDAPIIYDSDLQIEDQKVKPRYVLGEIIIKFKDKSDLGAVASNLLENQQSFETITDDSYLDKLNKKYNVKKLQKVFKSLDKKGVKVTGLIDKKIAKELNKEAKQNFYNYIKSLKNKSGNTNIAVLENEYPYLGNIYKVKMDKAVDINEACIMYAQDSNVEYAQPNYISSVSSIPNDPYYSSYGSWGQPYDDLWGLKKLQTEQAWDITSGEGVVVAVVDTGLDYNHPEILDNVWTNSAEIPGNNIDDDGNGFIDDIKGWDFSNNDNDPMDGHGHGTHVSGTIAAIGNNSIGIIGVAPGAKIMPLKGLSDFGSGYSDDLADAIVYAAINGADVINNSWGCSICPSNPVAEDAVRLAHGLNVVVVFAAGNSSGDVIDRSPQNIPETITVAASTELDEPAFFTNYGADIDVAAPGAGTNSSPPSYDPYRSILSLKSATTNSGMDGSGQLIVGTDYLRQAGTSMAAPHVSGLAALIIGAHGNFTTEQVRQAIRHGSDDVESSGYDNYTGYGRVNANKALNVNSPLEVLITKPQDIVHFGVAQLEIHGTVAGANLASWTLEYGTNPDQNDWTLIYSSTTPVNNGLLATWDLSTVDDGTNILRLRAQDTSGEFYEDRHVVILDNVQITEPSPDKIEFYRAGQSIVIRGTATPANFSHYDISIYKSTGYPLSDAVVDLTNGGTEKVVDNVLGTWDTTNVPADRYRILLAVTLQDARRIEENTYVVVDPTLHTGWPVDLGNIGSGIVSYALVDHLTAIDINADNNQDIIVGYGDSVRIFDHNGGMLPGWPQQINTVYEDALVQNGPAAGDLDGDGIPEIVASNNKSQVYVWYADGTLVPGWPKSLGGTIYYLAIDDINNDGNSEIISTDWNGWVKVIDIGGSYLPGWPRGYHRFKAPSIGDVDQDGFKEIAVIENTGPSRLYLLKYDGSIMPGWPKEINPTLASNYSSTSLVAMGDLDGNGDLELVVGSTNGYVYAFNHDGTDFNGWPQFTRETYLNSPAIGDINNDGLPEVIIGTDKITEGSVWKNYLYAFKNDGTLFEGWPIVKTRERASSFGFGTPSLADLDNDGNADIIVSYDNMYFSLRAFRFDGTELSEFPKPTASLGAFDTNTAAIADVDGDNLLELAWIDSYKNLYLWNTSAPVTVQQPWPMFQQNAAHTGMMAGNITCGNTICDVGESCSDCPQDCGICPPVCGDGTCDTGETCSDCPQDCGSCPPVCGDGTCDTGENCLDCPLDCGVCPPVCGDGTCDTGETCSDCPQDCGPCPPVCGDGTCETGETCSDCPQDCGPCPPVCGDGTCETGETCSDCPQDCGPCPPVCGDGTCETGENCLDCPLDCGVCPPVCGDGTCETGETCSDCPQDCGPCPPVCGDGYCAGSANGEDCSTCPEDCISGIGGSCSNCWKGKCDGVCDPRKETSACSDCAPSSCCGDGICSSGEDAVNCLIDCSECTTNADCSDGESCTIDVCNNGICENTWPACGISDGCCAPGCSSATDPDCPVLDCSSCFKGQCDGICNKKKDGPMCPDCL